MTHTRTQQSQQSTTYSNCGSVLADTALHENHIEVAVTSKCCTDKTEEHWQHLELYANHRQLHTSTKHTMILDSKETV